MLSGRDNQLHHVPMIFGAFFGLRLPRFSFHLTVYDHDVVFASFTTMT